MLAPSHGARTRALCPLPVHRRGANVCVMAEKHLFEELSARIDEALRNSPAQDIEKNLRALLASWFDRMDLVMRDEFDVQKRLLEAAQARLAALEARLADIERRNGSSPR